MLNLCRRECVARPSCTRQGYLVICGMLLEIRCAGHLGFRTRLFVGQNVHVRPITLVQATREGCAMA